MRLFGIPCADAAEPMLQQQAVRSVSCKRIANGCSVQLLHLNFHLLPRLAVSGKNLHGKMSVRLCIYCHAFDKRRRDNLEINRPVNAAEEPEISLSFGTVH